MGGVTQPRIVKSIEHRTWAVPRPGLALDSLILKLNSEGFGVLEVDRTGNRVLVAYSKEVM